MMRVSDLAGHCMRIPFECMGGPTKPSAVFRPAASSSAAVVKCCCLSHVKQISIIAQSARQRNNI